MSQQQRSIVSDSSICSYAEQQLGLSPGVDGRILWLAEFALCSPLPQGWTVLEDHTGQGYYYDSIRGKAQWEHPFLDEYIDLTQRMRFAIRSTMRYANISINKKRNDTDDMLMSTPDSAHAPPTYSEVVEMASWLGLDIVHVHTRLAWIAWQCCIAPIPLGWKAVQKSVASMNDEKNDGNKYICEEEDDNEDVVYVEIRTGLLSKSHPLDNVFKLLAQREKNILYEDRKDSSSIGEVLSQGNSLLTSLNQGPLPLSRSSEKDHENKSNIENVYRYDFCTGLEVVNDHDHEDSDNITSATKKSPQLSPQLPMSSVSSLFSSSPSEKQVQRESPRVASTSITSSRLPLSSRRTGSTHYSNNANIKNINNKKSRNNNANPNQSWISKLYNNKNRSSSEKTPTLTYNSNKSTLAASIIKIICYPFSCLFHLFTLLYVYFHALVFGERSDGKERKGKKR